MAAFTKTGILVLALATAISACSRDETPSLMNVRATGSGPDEFSVVPNKPLTIPEDLTALPAPTQNATNRTTQDADVLAVAALGGNPALLKSSKISGSEQALLNSAGRFGVDANIREKLSKEDIEFRKGNISLPLERLANVNVYNRIYSRYSLDAYAELQRLRRLGVVTPTAPPATR